MNNIFHNYRKTHPDCVKVIWNYGRWHHLVNFSPFKKNKLIKKEGVVIPDGINDYGMVLVDRSKLDDKTT